jgi:outer membrane protein assembly factor BamB
MLFCHHPLSSGEFAKPYEQLRLLETIRDHNVVLLLMGHGHSVRHEKWARLDSVMGGSTFDANTGYGIVRIDGDRLSVLYRYRDEAKPMQVVLEKSIAPQPRRFDVAVSDASIHSSGEEVIVETEIVIQSLRKAGRNSKAHLTISIDGDSEQGSAFSKQIEGGGARGRATRHRERVAAKDLAPGRHFLRVHGEIGNEPVDVTREFETSSKTLPLQVQRVRLDAGMKAGPLILGKDIIVATTGGQIVRLSPKDGGFETSVLHDAGVEILHTPALSDGILYVPAAEKGVIALDLAGRINWTCDVGSVVYGTPAVDDQRVYVGDLEGNVHAIRRTDGEKIWSEHHAQFSIEMPVVRRDDTLIFGAWDCFIYAISCHDGRQLWKTRSPAGHEGGKFTSRYYAGADCRPIVMGDRIVMADRAYRLGAYTLEGEYLGDLGEGIPAVGLAADGRGFFARSDSAGLLAFDEKGRQRWAAGDAVLGRFPIPPTAVGDRVYACSNRGRLYALDAGSGRLVWQYQVTPQLPVMAPLAATEDGVVVVVDMDGVVTRLQENR